MIIGGMQKLALVDYPGKVACTIFTKGCNFRCSFCHNAPLVLPEEDDSSANYTEDEVIEFLKSRRGLLDGVVISGGEPLINRDIYKFLKKIRDLNSFSIKLDTNGSYPDKLQKIISAGLVDYIAMDIKTELHKYSDVIGYAISPLIFIKSINIIQCSNIPYEFRTTVVKGLHEFQDIIDAAKSIQGAKSYYLQSFVDSGDLVDKNNSKYSSFSSEEMKDMLKEVQKYVPNAKLRGID